MKRMFTTLLLVLLFAAPLRAIQPDEILSDPVLEGRARALSADLRCLVCQNQSIDDSNAPLARDLRILLRERLKAGDSDSQAVDFIVARYGDFVLLRPRFNVQTTLLWIGPFALLLIAGVFLYTRRRGDGTSAEQALNADEQAALHRALERE